MTPSDYVHQQCAAYRDNSLLRTELLNALEAPAFKAALLLYESSQRKVDAADVAPEVASVRVLSRRAGAERLLDFLYELTQPNPQPPPDDPEPDFGITEEELAAVTPKPQ